MFGVVDPDTDRRVARGREFLEPRVEIRIRVRADEGKHTVFAINRNLFKRFAIDGNDRDAVLARGFGDELLEPSAEVVEFRRGNKSDLVAAIFLTHAKKHAELGSGIIFNLLGTARLRHRFAVREKRFYVDAHARRRCHSECRKCRETAADRGLSAEDMAE